MKFMPDVFVVCDECNGSKFSREILEIKYKGKNIADVLDMTIEEAEAFFKNIPLIYKKINKANLQYSCLLYSPRISTEKSVFNKKTS